MIDGFSKWARWKDRNGLAGIEFPGVYAIGISDTDMAGRPFNWCCEIVYVGMTNARGGVKSRLQQFENTIKGKLGHGGAHRVRFKHPDYRSLTPRLFVSICPRECQVTSNKPDDLRIMGEVAKQEYECLAVFVEKFGHFPEFNDRKRSPKG